MLTFAFPLRIVIVLQAMAWRLFVLPSTVSHARSCLLLGHVLTLLRTLLADSTVGRQAHDGRRKATADRLCGRSSLWRFTRRVSLCLRVSNPGVDSRCAGQCRIFLHHFFTFALLFIGQLAAFKCQGELVTLFPACGVLTHASHRLLLLSPRAVFTAAGHARANDLRVDGRVAHEYLSPPSRLSPKLAATSPEGSISPHDCLESHHVSSKIRACRLCLVLARSE